MSSTDDDEGISKEEFYESLKDLSRKLRNQRDRNIRQDRQVARDQKTQAHEKKESR